MKIDKMGNPLASLKNLNEICEIEQDWLFEKILLQLGSNRNLGLYADQHWGIDEYMNELGFQLTEKYQDIHLCYLDVKAAKSEASFLSLFSASLTLRFPEIIARIENDNMSYDILKLPSIIARRKKIRVAVFFKNAHFFTKYGIPDTFLRSLKLKLRSQRNCIFCIYGENIPAFQNLLSYSGPLSGFGRLYDLKHNPTKNRSASIRKLFYDYEKRIEHSTSIQLSYLADNHPYYIKLLAWHSLIRTPEICTLTILENALTDLMLHFELYYYKIVDSLTTKQINFLKALLHGNPRIYSRVVREKFELGSTSNIAQLTSSLEKKGIIVKQWEEITITDPIFREWLRRIYFRA